MGIRGRVERYRGKGQPARRLRRRLRQATRDRTAKILAGVLGAASVLSLMPGSVQQDLQLAVCKGVTVGVGRCRPVDLDLPPLPLPPARCTGLGVVADAFPLLSSQSHRRFGALAFERLATSDGAVHWLPSAALSSALPAAGAVRRVRTGPRSLQVPLEASWTFGTAERERAFAQSVSAASSHQAALSQLASLAARFSAEGSSSQLSDPTERQAQVAELPDLPRPSSPRVPGGGLAALSSPVTPTAPSPSTAAPRPAVARPAQTSVFADSAAASVSVDEVTGTATTTVPLRSNGRASAVTPAGMLQVDDDTQGRVARARLVLVHQGPTTVTLTFVDVQAGSDADAETLDRWATGSYGSSWAVDALAPRRAPSVTAPAWQQIFWASADAVRVVLSPAGAQDGTGASTGSPTATVQDALATWPRGYLGAGLWSGSLASVSELQAPVGAARAFAPVAGCSLAQVQPSGATPAGAGAAVGASTATPAVTAAQATSPGAPGITSDVAAQPAVRLRFSAPGCAAEPVATGWEQGYRCVPDGAAASGGRSSGYQVLVSSRLSALDDAVLVGSALLSPRRTGSWPGATVTGEVVSTWLSNARANRVTFRTVAPAAAGVAPRRSYGVLVTGAVPGGGTGAMLVTSDSQLDPSTVEDAVAGLSVARPGSR